MRSLQLTRSKKIVLVAGILLLYGAGFAYMISIFLYRMRPSPISRQEVRHLMSHIQINDTKTQVKKIFQASEYKNLRLRDDTSNLWVISTPYEIGAGNWILYIEFDKNNEVAGLYLRIADGISFRPLDPAPPDRIRSDWTTAYPYLLSNKPPNKALHPTAYSPTLRSSFLLTTLRDSGGG
jgi:hypothetical protein